MKEPLTTEQITAVHVGVDDGVSYVCPLITLAGGYVCGRCGCGALGREPKKGDACGDCGAKVDYVRRGPPEPGYGELLHR